MTDAYKILARKPEGKRPLRRHKHIDGKVILEWIFEK
jgi:hypothetical protein